MLKTGNVLSWNLFLREPGLVDRVERVEHARGWQDSIQGGSNKHQGSDIWCFADGTLFQPIVAEYEEERIKLFLRNI